jgi:hypothetical protein
MPINKVAAELNETLSNALLECLSAGRADEETPAAPRSRGIVCRFEDLPQAEPLPENDGSPHPLQCLAGDAARVL